MATGTPSPTPSEDNRKNNRDDTMYAALDKIMGNAVQNYDDFLNSFTYLKTGMQEKQDGKKEKIKKTENKMKKSKTIPATVQPPESGGTIPATVQPPESGRGLMLQCEEKKEISLPSNDIEEEILCEGDTTSRMAKTKVVKTGSLVKFDNFIDPVFDDADDVEEIDDVPGEGYTASFSAGNTVRTEKLSDVAAAGPSSKLEDDSDVTNMLDTQLSLDEKSTDKLLMNFLADLQNELNEGKPDSTAQDEETKSEMDIQSFLQKNEKSRQQGLESEEVNFNDDDENDAISLLHDDSEKNDVKVKISEKDFNKMTEVHMASECERTSRLDNIYSSALRDSEGNIQVVQSGEGTREQGTVNEEIDIDKIVFPGQVEERNDPPTNENDTLLDFKATFRETSDSTEPQIESTDLIQPFKLDEDFDYDNVVLTPKFSSEDLQHIKMTVKAQTVVM